MFFHAVKFLLSCIFLKNESVSHLILGLFLFSKGHSVPTARLLLDLNSQQCNIKTDVFLHTVLCN